ncbi:MAG TPA: hypothetical protein VNQ79_06530 [Blastocatellia bacterium]|nr:hypothetical protein [Blastocatellia bacterium]
MTEQLLTGNRFFIPSERLTGLLLSRRHQMLEAQHQEMFGRLEGGKAAALINEMAQQCPPQPAGEYRDDPVARMQRNVGEQIYHLLASMARTCQPSPGQEISLWEALSRGLAAILGLNRNRRPDSEPDPLVRELLQEFSDWLIVRHKSSWVAPWGSVLVDPQGKLVLVWRGDDNDAGQSQPRGPRSATADNRKAGSSAGKASTGELMSEDWL